MTSAPLELEFSEILSSPLPPSNVSWPPFEISESLPAPPMRMSESVLLNVTLSRIWSSPSPPSRVLLDELPTSLLSVASPVRFDAPATSDLKAGQELLLQVCRIGLARKLEKCRDSVNVQLGVERGIQLYLAARGAGVLVLAPVQRIIVLNDNAKVVQNQLIPRLLLHDRLIGGRSLIADGENAQIVEHQGKIAINEQVDADANSRNVAQWRRW
jgi:hypothetical protein